jgi:hypothetical protein
MLGIVYATFSRPATAILTVTIALGLMMIPFRVFLNVVFARMPVYGDPHGSSQEVTPDP